MELKHEDGTEKLMWGNLLIVPYGIETAISILWVTLSELLIVPYGIETFLCWSV